MKYSQLSKHLPQVGVKLSVNVHSVDLVEDKLAVLAEVEDNVCNFSC